MRKLLAALCLTVGLASCVNVNENLGGSFIATNQKYDFFTAEFDLDEIRMKPVDSLSAYSSRRITIGSIRDETFGLTRRGCAVTLVPVLDTVDYGTSPVFKKMVFRAAVDSISVPDDSQKNILQNINVYALNKPVDPKNYYSRTKLDHGSQRVTKGVPVANGSDSLAFEFTTEFGQKYLDITQEDLEDFDQYCSKFPGIYITTDDPVGNGGRFDMYKMDILEKEQGYLSRTNNYAILYYSGIYDGERKDSTLMFYFSPREFQDLDSLISASSLPEQYVFNVDYHESDGMAGTASDKIYIEGGSGLKPVIPAKEIWRLVNDEIARKGGSGKTALISKATIELPFDMPDDYDSMYLYPDVLSPTVQIKTDTTVSFAGLTDASASDENQGDINRSLSKYSPDITHHGLFHSFTQRIPGSKILPHQFQRQPDGRLLPAASLLFLLQPALRRRRILRRRLLRWRILRQLLQQLLQLHAHGPVRRCERVDYLRELGAGQGPLLQLLSARSCIR